MAHALVPAASTLVFPARPADKGRYENVVVAPAVSAAGDRTGDKIAGVTSSGLLLKDFGTGQLEAWVVCGDDILDFLQVG